MKSPLLLLASAISCPCRLRRTAEETAAVVLALRAEDGPPPFPSARKDNADPRPPLLPAAAARLLVVAAAVLPELLAPTRAVGVLGTAAGFVAQGLVFSCPADASMLLVCSIALPQYVSPPAFGVGAAPNGACLASEKAHANSLLTRVAQTKIRVSYVAVMSVKIDTASIRDTAGTQQRQGGERE